MNRKGTRAQEKVSFADRFGCTALPEWRRLTKAAPKKLTKTRPATAKSPSPASPRAPLLGKHAPEKEFYREAEALAYISKSMEDHLRGTGQPGTDAFSPALAGKRLAESHLPSAERTSQLQQAIRHSHSIRTLRQAELVARSFLDAVPRDDPERRAIQRSVNEILTGRAQAEIDQIEAITEELHARPGAHWHVRVLRISDATGFDSEMVDACLKAEEDSKRYPGAIDASSVPILEPMPGAEPIYALARALLPIIDMAETLAEIGLYFVPYLGNTMALYEVVAGKSAISGKHLERWERVLGAALLVIPFVKAMRRSPALLRGASRMRTPNSAVAMTIVASARKLG